MVTKAYAKPIPEPAAAGQESVWDYPRPPKIEVVPETLRVVCGGQVIAETRSGLRVLETSHPPNYYFPLTDVNAEFLRPSVRTSLCEFKGEANYFDLVIPQAALAVAQGAWTYTAPTAAFVDLAHYVAFYAQRVDACFVGDEQVVPQPGGFYGGWITSKVVGPFKGIPGSWGW